MAIDIDEILALPAEQRLDLLDRIWESLAPEELDSCGLSADEVRDIQVLLEDYLRDPADVVEWASIRESFLKKP
jgi:hypothetical protein